MILSKSASRYSKIYRSSDLFVNRCSKLISPLSERFTQTSKMVSNLSCTQQKFTKRDLSIHEYHSHEIMKEYGINVPIGKAVHSPEEAREAAKAMGGRDWIIKAQVLAGGRGKGSFSNGFRGGVHLVNSLDNVYEVASKMLGQRLITAQTTEKGRPVNTVLITERFYIRRETYIAFLMDSSTNGPTIVSSSNGGVDIEKTAAEAPNLILNVPIDIEIGVTDEQAEKVARFLGLDSNVAILKETANQIKKLYKIFIEKDITLLEINPMVETSDGRVVCLDAKVVFDDNALYRHKDIAEKRDWEQEDPRENIAAAYNLNYIGLEGDIACLVNGAGLAMATMDIIKLYGGDPANFLDVGGSATDKQVTEAFKILDEDPRVQAILVNIFGGIMQCDIIASGIINAAQQINLKKPVIVRLQGSNVERAKQLISSCGIRIISEDSLDQAAEKSVCISRIRKLAKKADLDIVFEHPS